jgi:hypothetical protein
LPANGLHILDVSDPANPVLLSSYTTTLNTQDVFVLAGIAYLLNDEKLEILDVQDPHHPQLLSEYPWSGVPDRIWVADGYAYVAFSSRGLHIIDVRDPMNPVFAGSFGDTGDFATCLNVREVRISGEIAYLGAYIQGAEQGLFVLDISNPAAPEQIGLFAGISIGDLFVHGQWLYLAETIYPSDPNAHVDHRFSVVDVSDPANPVVTGVFHSPFGFADALAIDGDELYIADNSGEIIAFDASNPGNLRLLGGYRPAYSGLPRLLKIIDKRAYFSEGGNLHILDIGDPANPAPLGHFTYDSDRFLDVDRHLAYFAHTEGFYYEDQDGFLEIFDLNDPANPSRRGALRYRNAIGNIDVSGDLAVVNSERLWSNLAEALFIDVSNPDEPVLKGAHRIEYRSFSDIEVVGRRVYLVTTRAGLLILDATDLENPALIGTYPEGDYLPSETPELLIDGTTAYMITSNQILILDIQDPAGVLLLGTIPNQPHRIEALQVKDHFLYASLVHGNLQIINLLGYREFLPLLQN